MFATPTPRKLRREKTTLSNFSDSDKEPVKVYCRLKPLNNYEESNQYIKLLSPQEIELVSETKGMKREVCYKFNHIFTSYASQKEIFDHVAAPIIEDLLNGKNGLLFTYGVTGSGKTYTLTGDQNNPGIIPKTIDTIFNSIGEFQAPKYVIKPDRMNGFEIQSADDALHERMAEIKSSSKTPKSSRRNNSEKINYTNDGSRVPLLNEKSVYSVFITYVEIYNNNVYDLLDESVNVRGTFQNKILREDSQRNMYVNSAVETEVKSAHEAFEVFHAGQKRKRTAFTNLNADSSRSHSIFNIRVVQLEQQETCNSDGNFVVPEGNFLKVSQMSLVDLAGSERTNRTQNTGVRLKEASCINNSLMNLRNCMETMRENQRTKSNKVVPYRDNKLTYLFKNYFEGDGSVQMIVCVNPSLNDLEENLHVMKFAELSQDVKITRSEPKFTPVSVKKTITKRIATPAKVKSISNFLSTVKIPMIKFDLEQLEEFGASVDKQMRALAAFCKESDSLDKEFDEQATKLRKRLVKIDKDHILEKNELLNLRNVVKKNNQRLHNYQTKMQSIEADKENLVTKNEELQDIVRSLHNIIDEKDLKLNQNLLEREKERQKIALANEKMNKELDEKLKKQRDHLNAAMIAKDIQLKKVREALNTEVIVKPQEARSEIVTPAVPQTPGNLPRRNMVTSTPRRHRSKSADGVWLEHNVIKPVQLGTVLQPTMKKRKSVTKLTKATDITNPKQSKYCLLAQEQDTDGETETKIYKADIRPTCGGGAQVIFNDVECLRQESPTRSPTK